MPHFPPLRVDIAILLLLVVAAGLALVALQVHRRRRRQHGIRVDLVGGNGHPDEGDDHP